MDTIQIESFDPGVILENKFNNGEIVFKITAIVDENEKEYGMVTTVDDYKERLQTHRYTPLFHFVTLHIRLAYLFNCFNIYYGVPRKEIFHFWWRDIGSTEWHLWFTVFPYTD